MDPTGKKQQVVFPAEYFLNQPSQRTSAIKIFEDSPCLVLLRTTQSKGKERDILHEITSNFSHPTIVRMRKFMKIFPPASNKNDMSSSFRCFFSESKARDLIHRWDKASPAFHWCFGNVLVARLRGALV